MPELTVLTIELKNTPNKVVINGVTFRPESPQYDQLSEHAKREVDSLRELSAVAKLTGFSPRFIKWLRSGETGPDPYG